MSIKLVDGGQTLKQTANWPASRSKLDWPFDAESFMNKPIGEDAVYVDCQFHTDGAGNPHELHVFRANWEHMINPALTDPLRNMYVCNNGGGCFPSTVNRCLGTVPSTNGLTGLAAGANRWPDSVIIPDGAVTVGNLTDTDAPASWSDPDNNDDTFWSTGGCAKCTTTGGIYTSPTIYPEDVKGDAYNNYNGAYGGAKIVMRGGTLKLEDITRTDDWIPHAGMLWLRPYTYYMNRTTQIAEYRWPARASDATFDKYPTTTGLSTNWEPYNLPSSFVPGLVQGALLAIPKTETANSVGIQTELGLKFFNMFQDYGCYLCNESGSNPQTNRTTIATTPEAGQAVIDIYGHDLGYISTWTGSPIYPPAGSDHRRWMEDIMAIWNKLHIVSDNAADNIGGAGTLRFRPPAPPFSD